MSNGTRILVIVLAVVLTTPVIVALHWFYGTPVSPRALSSMRSRVAPKEVEQLFGPPDRTVESPYAGGKCWIYGKWHIRRELRINSSDEPKVVDWHFDD